jgi:zinc transport system substrate-binding protein
MNVNQIKYLNDNRPFKKMCLLAEANTHASQYQKLGDVWFQKVDENLSGQQNFLQAWQALAKNVQQCVMSARQ